MGIKAEKAVVFKETTKDSKYMGKRLRVKFLMQKAVGFDFHSLFFPRLFVSLFFPRLFVSLFFPRLFVAQNQKIGGRMLSCMKSVEWLELFLQDPFGCNSS